MKNFDLTDPVIAFIFLLVLFLAPYFLLFFALPFLSDSWLVAFLPVMDFYLKFFDSQVKA
jgi:hypothetical protein